MYLKSVVDSERGETTSRKGLSLGQFFKIIKNKQVGTYNLKKKDSKPIMYDKSTLGKFSISR